MEILDTVQEPKLREIDNTPCELFTLEECFAQAGHTFPFCVMKMSLATLTPNTVPIGTCREVTDKIDGVFYTKRIDVHIVYTDTRTWMLI